MNRHVPWAEYLGGIPADRSNRAAEIAGISQAQRAHLATLQSFVSFETVVCHGPAYRLYPRLQLVQPPMAKKKQPLGESMDLGNMRRLGVHRQSTESFE